MVTITYDNNKIEVYDSLNEIPIQKYKEFQRYAIIDSGIGSNIDDILSRFNDAQIKLTGENKTQASEAINNIYFSFANALAGMDYKTKSFAALVYKLNGSDTDIDTIVNVLQSFPESVVKDTWEKIKKKLIPNWMSIFKTEEIEMGMLH